ncbi:sigma-70 family RNA polymerase sigma factor [Kitasatospora sp. NPDC050463]|uniref:sigma-70 family RNA polymerase sigma factor n=1 Tax=Kitasatospora sp. NPDC050463 TaxID=3155786 RepID=UPI0033E67A9C
MSGRRTRPWADLRGSSPQDNATAALMRTWMDEAALTVSGLHSALTHGRFYSGPVPSRTTVADRLAGCNLTGEFIDAVAAACFPDEAVATERARQARGVLDGFGRFFADRTETIRATAVNPLALAQLHQQVEDLRGRPGADSAKLVTQLYQENSQLRLNVAELGKRVHALTKELSCSASECEQLRRRLATTSQALAAARSRAGVPTERPGRQPAPPCPQTRSAAERAGAGPNEDLDDEPPTAEPPTGPAGGPPSPLPPTTGLSGGGGPPEPGGRTAPVGGARSVGAALLTDPAGAPEAVGPDLPLEFEAFYLSNVAYYTAYAKSRLGDERLTRRAVDEAFGFILDRWQQLVREPQLAASTWDVLLASVASHTRSFSADAALARAMQKARAQLDAMQDGLGLYAAISELPPRQFDVIVLRYVAGRSTTEIGLLMDISVRTVDYHLSRAKDRLARSLSLDNRPEGTQR